MAKIFIAVSGTELDIVNQEKERLINRVKELFGSETQILNEETGEAEGKENCIRKTGELTTILADADVVVTAEDYYTKPPWTMNNDDERFIATTLIEIASHYQIPVLRL